MEKAKVYFTEEITPEALQRIYHALGVSLKGKVAVKISTGEPGGHNFLQPPSSRPWSRSSAAPSWSATPPIRAAATPARPTGRP